MAKTLAQDLKALWNSWKRLAHKIGNFQARVLLTILYAIVVLPFGLIVHLFSDPLHIKSRPTKWSEHSPELYDMSWAQKQ
jgi:hypothetical protein